MMNLGVGIACLEKILPLHESISREWWWVRENGGGGLGTLFRVLIESFDVCWC